MMPRGVGWGVGGRVILASLTTAHLPEVGPVNSSHRGGHSHLQLVRKHSLPCPGLTATMCQLYPGCRSSHHRLASSDGPGHVGADALWPGGAQTGQTCAHLQAPLGLMGTQSIETDCLGKTPFPTGLRDPTGFSLPTPLQTSGNPGCWQWA